MSQFMEIKVLTGNGMPSKPVTLNTAMISHVESCDYESAIQGVKKKGTAVFCAGQIYVTATEYEKISRALMMGKFAPDDLIN